MFWLSRKAFSGSHLLFTSCRRAQVLFERQLQRRVDDLPCSLRVHYPPLAVGFKSSLEPSFLICG
jgi:hypothetical protein